MADDGVPESTESMAAKIPGVIMGSQVSEESGYLPLYSGVLE